MSEIKAIAAMARNRVIGCRGSIPWRISDELKWFKEATSGHGVIMGRKTFESLGRPLPNRHNIVVTRGVAINVAGVTTLQSLSDITPGLAGEGKHLFVIGGGEIYEQLLPHCTELLLTVLPVEVEGDTFFPRFEPMFRFSGIIRSHPQFEVRRYERA